MLFSFFWVKSQSYWKSNWVRWHFKNAYKLLNIMALKFSLDKIQIFKCMSKIFYVEFQREPLKFHTKYLTHTLKDMIFIWCWKFKSSQIYELVRVFEAPLDPSQQDALGCISLTFFPSMELLWKSRFTVYQFLDMISLHSFSRVMTQRLTCHVHKIVMISRIWRRAKWNIHWMWITMEKWSVKWVLLSFHWFGMDSG